MALLGLLLLYAITVLPSLGDNPIAGGDEGWIISASSRLAEDGVFGSELFTGFYDAEDNYFFNLPLHHLILAGVFKVTGTGLAEGRSVSFVFGALALLLTFAVARRIAGDYVAIGAAALLVLLRLNLTPFSGLTLTDLGATVRYDLISVPFGLAALLVLLRRPAQPALGSVLLAGLLLGLAALTQFIGAFYALPVALFLLTLALPLRRRLLLTGLLAGAMLLPFLPYTFYIAADWDDFRGQARSVEQKRDFLSPGFYVDQLVDERHRYAIGAGLEELPDSADLLRRPSARLGLLLGLPAAALLLWRARKHYGRRLLGLTLVCGVVELALFESTKRYVYFVAAVPLLCIALADLAAWAWTLQADKVPKLLPRLAVVLVAAVFAAEGLAVAAQEVREARNAPSYAALGDDLARTLAPGAVLLGDNRLWPAAEAHGLQLRSLLLVFYHTNPEISRERATDVFGALERIDPDYIVISPLSRDILAGLSQRDAADWQRFLETRTELRDSIAGPPYGPMEVYRVK